MEIKYFTKVNPPCCSCPDWLYRGRIRPCKHVRRLRDAYALIASQDAKNAKAEVVNCQHLGNLVK